MTQKKQPKFKKRCKAQIYISFIVGVGVFMAVCFAVALFASNNYPVVISDLSYQKNSFIFSSFVNKVMGNLSQGEYILNESVNSFSQCTFLDKNDAASISSYNFFQQKFGVENYSYMINAAEMPIAVTTTPNGANYEGNFIIEGNEIDVVVSKVGINYDTVTLNGLVALNEGEATNLFTTVPIYVEKIDKKGQFVIFKKQIISCGNYYNILTSNTMLETKYLLSKDKNIIQIMLALW
ncbi:MAG: hypothetical protein DRN66_01365 [Candidatus Nanohalarchaeota archaeon]|nr:MAG: hypothetical protein DRN66_01365 [Candidatus Nanohaloarchaeota archaeon]